MSGLSPFPRPSLALPISRFVDFTGTSTTFLYLFFIIINTIKHCATKVYLLTVQLGKRIKTNKCYYQLWKESLGNSFGLNGHQEVQTGDIYVRQSNAEQWLRLISILMNANWHICYGGLAVQTLQLAWLINYPPAGGSLEMEAGNWAKGGRVRKRDERAWEEKKSTELSNMSLISYVTWTGGTVEFSFLK